MIRPNKTASALGALAVVAVGSTWVGLAFSWRAGELVGVLGILGILGFLFRRAIAQSILDVDSSESSPQRQDDEAQVSRQKSQFMSTMNTEIRGTTNGLLGMAQLLGTTNLDEVQRELVVDINHSAAALLDIINDTLEFSEIENGELTLHSEAFDLEVLAHDVCSLLAHGTEAKDLELILDYAPTCPRKFTGDAGRVRQVLVNLIGNGIKFAGRSHVLLEISCLGTTGDERTISMAIPDFGLHAGSRAYGGTGLGLALTKQLVDAMGGSVELKGMPNGASTFRMTLPLQADITAGSNIERDQRDMRVLLVSEHPVNRRVLSSALTAHGLRVDRVSDQLGAMKSHTRAAADGSPYQLLVVDEPVSSDGNRLVSALLDNPLFADVPFISVISPQRHRETADDRVVGYLRKPISSDSVSETLSRVAQTSHRPEEEAPKTASVAVSKEPGQKHILVVEDNPVNLRLACFMLGKLGYKVTTVTDGRQAVEYLAASCVDLVLMDCQMPVLDGYRATAQIREGELIRGGHVPILALTADASGSNKKDCLACGMDDFLTKPCTSADFEKAFERWIPARSVGPRDLRGPVSRTHGVGTGSDRQQKKV